MGQQGKVKTIATQHAVFMFVIHMFVIHLLPRICFSASIYVVLLVRYEREVKMFVTMFLCSKATKFH